MSTLQCHECKKPFLGLEHKEDTCPQCLKKCINPFIQELYKQGFKKYIHSSNTVAWSKENLCEYSDEWISEEDIPY